MAVPTTSVGIVATYVPPDIDPSNSTVTGNICRNIGAGFQHYGFSYEWGNLLDSRAKASGLHFSGNDFSGNLLGEMKRILPPEKTCRR